MVIINVFFNVSLKNMCTSINDHAIISTPFLTVL